MAGPSTRWKEESVQVLERNQRTYHTSAIPYKKKKRITQAVLVATPVQRQFVRRGRWRGNHQQQRHRDERLCRHLSCRQRRGSSSSARPLVLTNATGGSGGGRGGGYDKEEKKKKTKNQKKNPFSTVEAAVKFLAQLLSAGDMFGTVGSKPSNSPGLGLDDVKVELRGWKWIKISGKASATLRVTTANESR